MKFSELEEPLTRLERRKATRLVNYAGWFYR